MADTDIAVTVLTVTPGYGELVATWSYTAASSVLPYLQLDHFEVWVASTNDRTTATHIADQVPQRFRLGSLGVGDTRYFWVRPVDKSGNLGDFYPLGSTAGVTGTVSDVVPDGSLDLSALDTSVGKMVSDLMARQQDLLLQVQELQLRAAEQDLANFMDVQTIQQSLTSQNNTLRSDYKSMVVAATGPTSTIVTSIAALNSSINDPSIGLNASATAIIALSTAVGLSGSSSSFILDLMNTVGYQSGHATFFIDDSYTPSAGFTLGFALQLSVAGTGHDVGLWGETDGVNSRLVLGADQIVFKTGVTIAGLFQAGTLNLDLARIVNLETANLHASMITVDTIAVTSSISAPSLIKGASNSSAQSQKASNTTVTLTSLNATPVAAAPSVSVTCNGMPLHASVGLELTWANFGTAVTFNLSIAATGFPTQTWVLSFARGASAGGTETFVLPAIFFGTYVGSSTVSAQITTPFTSALSVTITTNSYISADAGVR